MQELPEELPGLEAPRQASGNRNLWVVIILVLALACFCVVVAAVVVGGSLFISGRDVGLPDLRHEETERHVVEAGAGARLEVDNFGGDIHAEAAPGDQIEIVAVKSGPPGANLSRIQVEIAQKGATVIVRTTRPLGLSNLSVRLEIRAPASTGLDLGTGAGEVQVQGFVAGVMVETGSGSVTARGLAGDVGLNTGSGSVQAQDLQGRLAIDSGSGSLKVEGLVGDLEAHTGSGGIEVRGANGNARIDTGSGTVEYQGAPTGECRFETGTGGVVLRLPAELDFRVQAETGSGSVDVQFEVEGRVSRQHVEGVVGTGQEATIIASTGSGGIDILKH